MGKIRNRGRTDVKKGLVRQGNVVGDRHEQREVRGVTQQVEYLKSTNVVKLESVTKIISEPDPPLPPSGPPIGTYFSILKEVQPSPPAPAIIFNFNSSTNM